MLGTGRNLFVNLVSVHKVQYYGALKAVPDLSLKAARSSRLQIAVIVSRRGGRKAGWTTGLGIGFPDRASWQVPCSPLPWCP